MPRLFRKFIAVLMLLWLPLFSGSALASAVSMQMQPGHGHEAASVQAMPGMDMGEHCQHHSHKPAPADKQSHSCNTSCDCHLACAFFLALPSIGLISPVQALAHDIPPYLLSFRSVTSAPLVPPPLARA